MKTYEQRKPIHIQDETFAEMRGEAWTVFNEDRPEKVLFQLPGDLRPRQVQEIAVICSELHYQGWQAGYANGQRETD